MNTKNMEKQLEVLIGEYRSFILNALNECQLDPRPSLESKFDSKLRVIYKAAEYDGLPQSTIDELVQETRFKGPQPA